MSTSRPSWPEFQKTAPQVVQAMRSFTPVFADAGLDKGLLEMVKVRCSQINGCAFCVEMHLKLAREAGVTQQKLDLLAVWRESAAFDAKEKAALHWAELLTRMPNAAEDEAAYEALGEHFTREQVIFLSTAIAHINFWNRIAGPFRFKFGS